MKSLIYNMSRDFTGGSQWLRLCTPKAGGLALIPGQGPRFHMLQPRPGSQIKQKHAQNPDKSMCRWREGEAGEVGHEE